MNESSEQIYISRFDCPYDVSVVAPETASEDAALTRSEALEFVFLRQQLSFRVPFASLEHDWLLWRLLLLDLYFYRRLF